MVCLLEIIYSGTLIHIGYLNEYFIGLKIDYNRQQTHAS